MCTSAAHRFCCAQVVAGAPRPGIKLPSLLWCPHTARKSAGSPTTTPPSWGAYLYAVSGCSPLHIIRIRACSRPLLSRRLCQPTSPIGCHFQSWSTRGRDCVVLVRLRRKVVVVVLGSPQADAAPPCRPGGRSGQLLSSPIGVVGLSPGATACNVRDKGNRTRARTRGRPGNSNSACTVRSRPESAEDFGHTCKRVTPLISKVVARAAAQLCDACPAVAVRLRGHRRQLVSHTNFGTTCHVGMAWLSWAVMFMHAPRILIPAAAGELDLRTRVSPAALFAWGVRDALWWMVPSEAVGCVEHCVSIHLGGVEVRKACRAGAGGCARIVRPAQGPGCS